MYNLETISGLMASKEKKKPKMKLKDLFDNKSSFIYDKSNKRKKNNKNKKK